MKKVLSTILSILILFCVFPISNAQSMEEKELHKLQRESINTYVDFMKSYNSQDGYIINYAGSYLDEKGNLNICIFNISEKDKIDIIEKYQNKDIIFHDAKFTYKYLNELIENIIAKIDSLKENEINITGGELDEKNNRVNVYIDSNDEKKTNYLKSLFCTDALNIVYRDKTMKALTYPINVGAPTLIYNGDSLVAGGTISCCAEDSNGNIGVVTHGHGINVGYTLNDSPDIVLGEFTIRKFSGNCDASFAQITNSDYIPSYNVHNYTAHKIESCDMDVYPVGTGFSAFGITSKWVSGTISSNNAWRNISGTLITGLYIYNTEMEPGDSGGPLLYNTYWNYPISFYYDLAGIASGGGDGETAFIKIENVLDKLNLSSIYTY